MPSPRSNPTITKLTRIGVTLTLALMTGFAAAQKYTPPPPPLTTGPCKPTKKDPCPPPANTDSTSPATPNAFPFPGEETQDAPDAAKAPTPLRPGSTPSPTQGSNPFPGEPPVPPTSSQGAIPFPGEPAADPSSSSSSSSSSSTSSSDASADPDQPALKDEGSAGSTRFSRKKLPKVTVIDPDERESKDVEVSHYYFTTGNFEASYLRAKDAVTTIPDDPAAHLALAQAAARLNKPDEARAEYNNCLKLDATDPQVKQARKGLAELPSAGQKQAAK